MNSSSKRTPRLFYFPFLIFAESDLLSQTYQRMLPFFSTKEIKSRFLELSFMLKGLQTCKKLSVPILSCLPLPCRRQLCDSSCRQHSSAEDLWLHLCHLDPKIARSHRSNGEDTCFWPARRAITRNRRLLAKSGIPQDSLNHTHNVHVKVHVPVDLSR